MRVKRNHKVLMGFNASLLALLPMFESVILALPMLQQFLPENVYKVMGASAVIGNLVIGFFMHKGDKDDSPG